MAASTDTSAATIEIEHLLSYVKTIDGAVFIRNGSEHTAIAAEAHLRMKWEKQRSKISSAEKFIELCATQSSISGTPYQIRLKDGQVQPAATLLIAELTRFRSAVKTPAASP
ncbi:MAG TPA: DUF5329 family protein [Rariglobus sp.]|nr:DUF5329 family protein [Rariglobus sp.]